MAEWTVKMDEKGSQKEENSLFLLFFYILHLEGFKEKA